MVHRRGMTRCAFAFQKIEHEPRTPEAVWAVAIPVAYACESSSEQVSLQVGSTYALEMYNGVMT